MPVNRKGGPWEGGYISLGRGGRETYFIEREVGGERFHVSTRCHSRRAAIKQLERFEGDPLGYRPEGEAPESDEPLRLTAELVEEFTSWSIDTKGNSRKHANDMAHRLAEWTIDLAGRDIRTLSAVHDLKPVIRKRGTCTPHRIIAIKSLCSWLRKERGLLKSAEDPTLDLPVPQSRPEKWKRRKAVDEERVRKAWEKLPADYRDVLTLMAATGWHETELGRFVRSPASEIVYPPPGGTVLAVLVTKHKGGEPTRTPLSTAEALGAAERLRVRKTVPKKPNQALREACSAAGVEPFTIGVMRHTVGTWAVQRGADPALVSQFLGHKDPRTTKRFYIDVAIPTNTVPLPTLKLVDGGKS